MCFYYYTTHAYYLQQQKEKPPRINDTGRSFIQQPNDQTSSIIAISAASPRRGPVLITLV